MSSVDLGNVLSFSDELSQTNLQVNQEKKNSTPFIDKNEIANNRLAEIQELSDGVYLTCFSSAADAPGKHTIAIIKNSQEKSCIFDPNIGLLSLEDDSDLSKTLCYLTDFFYSDEGFPNLFFYSCC